MTRSFVTGGAGFVGSNLIRALLLRGDEVHALVRPDGSRWRLPAHEHLVLHEVDMTKAGALTSVVTAVRPELVFHLAHYGGNRNENDEARIRSVIIDATAELYATCEAVGSVKSIVHAGSSSEYGTKSEPMYEGMLPEPNTPYGCAKLWATLYGEHLRREKNMPIATLRLFSVYGPYEASTRLVPAVTRAFLKGEIPTLANPHTSRDFVYIEDVVQAFLVASAAEVRGVYNVGTGMNQTLEQAVTAICNAVGVDTALTWGDDAGRSFDTTLWVADTGHTEKTLGWKATTSLEEGIVRTVAWFKNNEALYERA